VLQLGLVRGRLRTGRGDQVGLAGERTRTISGTSMASPHVAGVGALYKSTFGDASSATVASWINTNGSAGVIRGNVSGTPNRLLNKRTL
jgi:subtilisin family serine protease